MDSLHTSVNAARAVQRMVVSAALGLSVPPELDVSPIHVIAPASAPGVLDEPVVALGGVSPVTDQQHRVVDNNVLVIIAAVKHTLKWRLEKVRTENTQSCLQSRDPSQMPPRRRTAAPCWRGGPSRPACRCEGASASPWSSRRRQSGSRQTCRCRHSARSRSRRGTRPR